MHMHTHTFSLPHTHTDSPVIQQLELHHS
uniref:Uncharacterized protein n=1 Tax=Anguilla anguilla TaxID=7936 RepID=A0A0E9WZG7_ANGAN